MQNLVQLQRDQPVDLRDAGLNAGLRVAGQRHFPFQHLGHKLLDHVPAAFESGRVAVEAALGNDLFEQALFRGNCRSGSCCCLFLWAHSAPPVPSSALSLARDSVFDTASKSASSSLSFPCRLPRRSESLVRRSSNSLVSSDCCSTGSPGTTPFAHSIFPALRDRNVSERLSPLSFAARISLDNRSTSDAPICTEMREPRFLSA